MKTISLIVSVYNEEAGLRQFFSETEKVLSELTADRPDLETKIWFVNDGSSDRSGELLQEFAAEKPGLVRIVEFSRNFGHEAAMCAGLDYADGDYLIFMDADLQHPPVLIPQIHTAFEEGADIIPMVRTRNDSAGFLKNLTSRLYYRLINRISSVSLEPGASDFFAIDRQAAEVLRGSYRDKIRFLRGYVQNIGFCRKVLTYEAADRVAGKSHYSFRKLWKLSMDTVVCFSEVPLKAGFYAGTVSALAALILLLVLLCGNGGFSPVWGLAVFLLGMFAVLFFLVGILGKYMAALLTETRDRPVYIVKNLK